MTGSVNVDVDPAISAIGLPIVETFHSVQGEGAWCGTNAFFIRLAGCDVGCPWCDTKISWSPKAHPHRSIDDLVQAAAAAAPSFVVITGGEPLMHDLTDLTRGLKTAGLRIHLETSGSHGLTGEFDWVTLSPKPFKPPLDEIYHRVDELKMVVGDAADFAWAEVQSAKTCDRAVRYLQPEWTRSGEAQSLIFDYVLGHPQWRMSLQTHKLLGVR